MHLVAALSAAGLMFGASAPALAVSETPEGFSQAMQGCWNRTTWSAEIQENRRTDPGYTLSSQICLIGGVTGDLVVYDCTGGNNLVECSQMQGTYEFRDEKFWRSYGESGWLSGGLDNCDVRFGPGEQFELHNCSWATMPESGREIEDAGYEKAIGQ